MESSPSSPSPAGRRWLFLEAPSTNVPLLLRRFSGREAISEPFAFRLEFEVDDAHAADCEGLFEALVGRPATVRMERDDSSRRSVFGIVRWVSEDSVSHGATRFSAELVPPLWRTTQRQESRIFQRKTVIEILKQVLKTEHRLDVAFDIAENHERRNYCVQYRETDFQFVSRLMEDEGLYYYFRHHDSGCQMVIGDNSTLDNSIAQTVKLAIDRSAGDYRQEPAIHAWSKRQTAGAASVRFRDHSFQNTGVFFDAVDSLPDSVACGRSTHVLKLPGGDDLRLSDFPGGFAHRFDGIGPTLADDAGELNKIQPAAERRARLFKERSLADRLEIQARCNCAELSAGSRLVVSSDRHESGAYLVASVEHCAIDDPFAQEESRRGHYENGFTALPSEIRFRPAPRTQRPRTEGCQTATVVAIADDEVTCDPYGRVKVRFHWDRSASTDEDASCWVRVGQAWANKGYGWLAIPRAGDEVIVDFLHGDPDCPIIVGSVYNNRYMPPVKLPEGRTCTFLKSKTRGSDTGYSGFGIVDQGGKEFFQLRSEKDRTDTTNESYFENVGKNRYSVVGNRTVTHVGGLPLVETSRNISASVGSGEGSGAGTPTQNPHRAGNHPALWKSSVIPGVGQVLDFTIGCRNDAMIGYNVNLAVGSRLNTTINPLGAATYLKAPVGTWTSIARGVAAVNGACTVVFGSKTDMIYGPTIKITRGPVIEVKVGGNGDLAIAALDKALFVAQAFVVATHLAARLTYALKPNTGIGDGSFTLDDLIVGLAGAGAPEIATSVLAYLEFKRAYSAQHPPVNQQQQQILNQIVDQPQVLENQEQVQENIDHQQEIVDNQLQNQEMSLNSNAGQGTGLVNNVNLSLEEHGESYGVLANRIQFLSAPGPLASKPSMIAIEALGKMNLGGHVRVYGNESCHFSGGTGAYLYLKTNVAKQSQVWLDGGPMGEIEIRLGPPGLPSSFIKMSPTEIVLSADPAGVSKLTLTSAGIELKSGPSKLELTPAGVNLQGVTAEVAGKTVIALKGKAIMASS